MTYKKNRRISSDGGIKVKLVNLISRLFLLFSEFAVFGQMLKMIHRSVPNRDQLIITNCCCCCCVGDRAEWAAAAPFGWFFLLFSLDQVCYAGGKPRSRRACHQAQSAQTFTQFERRRKPASPRRKKIGIRSLSLVAWGAISGGKKAEFTTDSRKSDLEVC